MTEHRIEQVDVLHEKINQSMALCEIVACVDKESACIETIKDLMIIASDYLFTAHKIITDLFHEELKEKCQDIQTIQS